MRQSGHGKIVIISSPSGGGKSSICRKLLSPQNKRNGWRFSISVTTRPPRRNERNGREYWFVDYPEFVRRRKRHEFAESCQVHRFYYGTPRKPLDEVLHNGGVIFLDVDVKGAFALKNKYKMAATIFILPPDKAELKRRLKKRGTEDDSQFRIRQSRALSEMKLFKEFEYVVINKDLITAVKEVKTIVDSLHCRRDNLNLEHINRIVG